MLKMKFKCKNICTVITRTSWNSKTTLESSFNLKKLNYDEAQQLCSVKIKKISDFISV